VGAKLPRNRVPALPATRAALLGEDTTGSNATEKHGSKDATGVFRHHENLRFSDDSESRTTRRRSRLKQMSSVSRAF
jgi:hypothetical protein